MESSPDIIWEQVDAWVHISCISRVGEEYVRHKLRLKEIADVNWQFDLSINHNSLFRFNQW